MDSIFITSGNKENCQNWEKFQTPLGLRGNKFRFIILALGTTGSGKTDAPLFVIINLMMPLVTRKNGLVLKYPTTIITPITMVIKNVSMPY